MEDRNALQTATTAPHKATAQLASTTSVTAELPAPVEPHRIADRLHVSSDGLVLGLVAANVITLVGSMVTGRLARDRRLQLAEVNSKLRSVRALTCLAAANC